MYNRVSLTEFEYFINIFIAGTTIVHTDTACMAALGAFIHMSVIKKFFSWTINAVDLANVKKEEKPIIIRKFPDSLLLEKRACDVPSWMNKDVSVISKRAGIWC